MWILFFVCGLLGAIVLFVHINLEMNSLGKRIETLCNELKKYYEGA